MADPFLIPQPFVVSFSGGRTSGLMLRRILDAHGGQMPSGSKVIFANTGKERAETLTFVDRVSREWGVAIDWLEFRYTDNHKTFAVVDYARASREGEPFTQVIRAHNFLPNVVTRFCTTELKIRTIRRYLRSLGWDAWTEAIGLRADEPRRVARLMGSRERGDKVCPLAPAGITLDDVNAFWDAQPFSLGLRPHEGNCDLCFLKGQGKIESIVRDRPDLAEWWIERERERELIGVAVPRAARFRKDAPSYAATLEVIQRQGTLFTMDNTIEECHCTD
jgi:3'-phosphoadenosine 5'-phosphosulfate sulfotransferase (PAPS reductase)/FAD synthetase